VRPLCAKLEPGSEEQDAEAASCEAAGLKVKGAGAAKALLNFTHATLAGEPENKCTCWKTSTPAPAIQRSSDFCAFAGGTVKW